MSFYFVQRINQNISHKGPITNIEQINYDYMGSAEFEYGALPKAFQVMRKQKLKLTNFKVTAFDTETTFHVVVPSKEVKVLKKSFQNWFDNNLPGKENPYLDRTITKKGWRGEPMSERELRDLPVSWWTLKESMFFSLEKSIAQTWLGRLRSD